MVGVTNLALFIIFALLTAGAFIFEVVALVHAARVPAQNFAIAGKLTKPWWMAILGLATLFGFVSVWEYVSPLLGEPSPVSFGGSFIFVVAAFVAAAIYMAGVRPEVSGSGRGGSSSGPYGPW